MPGNFHKNKKDASLQSNSRGRKCAKSVLVRRASENLTETMRCAPPHHQHSQDPGERRRGRGKASSAGAEDTVQQKPENNRRMEQARELGKNHECVQELSTGTILKHRDDRLFSR